MDENNESPAIEEMQARDLEEGLKHAEETDTRVYALRNTNIVGDLDLSNRVVNVAVDIQRCEFLDEVDLSYCEFKQTVDFSHCTFHQRFLAGDESRSHTVFQKDLICNDAVFCKAVYFRGVICKGKALFRNACFQSREDEADFGGASFEQALDFENTDFCGGAKFLLISCGYASFDSARFDNEVRLADFTAASFKALSCSGVIFKGPVSFNGVECAINASFQRAKFLGETQPEDKVLRLPFQPPPIDFTAASFKNLDCYKAIFKGPVSFNGVECAAAASFRDAKFENDKEHLDWGENEAASHVDFAAATFQDLNCSDAIFKGSVTFNGTKCAVNASFRRAQFIKNSCLYPRSADLGKDTGVDFAFTHFGSNLDFTSSIFQRAVRLEEAIISSNLDLTAAQFEDNVSFYDTTIGRLVFKNPSVNGQPLDLRGCTFNWFRGSDDHAKLLVERQDAVKLSIDPYLQLEKHYNRIGDEAKAKDIYREGRHKVRKNAKIVFKKPPANGENIEAESRAQWPWRRHLSDLILAHLTGYGVQTWRLFVGALIFILIGTVVFAWSPNTLVEAGTSPSSVAPDSTLVASIAPAEGQSLYDWRHELFPYVLPRLAYSLDLFLPVVHLGLDERWEPHGSVPQAYAFFHMFFGWLLVPLLLASLAGIIKRQG